MAALCAGGAIVTDAVRDAFLRVRREEFAARMLQDADLELVYSDVSLPIKSDEEGTGLLSCSSQPSLMARMIELLCVRRGDNVLEVGTGSGYNAALLAELVGPEGRVTTLEIDRDLGQRAADPLSRLPNVDAVIADGNLGWPHAAPYDSVILTAGSPQLRTPWFEQLRDDGRLVLPLGLSSDGGIQAIVAFEKRRDCLVSTNVIQGACVPLRTSIPQSQSARPNVLSATARTHGHEVFAIDISGPALEGLTSDELRRLLGNVLRDPSEFEIHPGFIGDMAQVFLTLCRGGDVVEYYRAGDITTSIAILSRPDCGLAVLRAGTATIERYGPGQESVNALQEAVSEWERLQEPTLKDLRIRAHPGDSQLGTSWATERRSGWVLEFDWMPPIAERFHP